MINSDDDRLHKIRVCRLQEEFALMKIIVIGAGPAGLSTAYNAAKQGHEVDLFEKNSEFGEKPCGEALPRQGLNYISKLQTNEFVENKYNGLVFSYQHKVFNRFETEIPIGYVINKKRLLQLIANEVENLGVRIHKSCTVKAVDSQKGNIKVKNEIFHGDLVVCADGAASLSHSQMNCLNKNTPCLQAKCMVKGELERDKLHIEFFKEGYFWVFFKNEDTANIGIIKTTEKPLSIKPLLNTYIKKVGAKPIEHVQAAIVPIGGPIDRMSFGKMVVSGDAAGHVNPISGEGIRFALYSGSIAFLEKYEEHFAKKFGSQLKQRRVFLESYQRAIFKNEQERLGSLTFFTNLF